MDVKKRAFTLLLPRYALSISLLTCVSLAQAGELRFDAGVDLTYVDQTIKAKDDPDYPSDSENRIITPYLGLTYTARDLVANVVAEHNNVHRSLEDADVTNNYTNFSYFANYDIIKNLLSLNAIGRQNYSSFNNQAFSVDDFLLNADNLVKTRYNSATLALDLPVGDYFGSQASLNVSKSTSEQEDDVNPNVGTVFNDFDNETYVAQWAIQSGRDVRPVRASLDTTAQLSKRNIQNDYESRFANASIGSDVYSHLSVNLLGSYESYDFKDDENQDNPDTKREYYSYGLGLRWQSSVERYIEVGINKSTSKGSLFSANADTTSNDQFISVDAAWQFTPRTSVIGSYSRSFFGDTGNLTLAHKLRTWRTQLTYREDVNTSTQLAQIEEEGLFVCNNGAANLSECSLPISNNPADLEDGQFLVPFVQTGFELNDNVLLRKALRLESAVSRRRTTVSLAVAATKDEDLESSRTTDVLSTQLTTLFDISQRSNLSFTLNYADNEQFYLDETSASIVKEASVAFTRRLTRRFFASIKYRYLDRQGDSNVGGGAIAGIQGPLTDRRISISLEYKFTNE